MTEDGEPQLPVYHYVLLAFVAILILVTNAVAQRSILLNNVPDVAHLADLPPAASGTAGARQVFAWGALIPTSRLRPPLARMLLPDDAATQPKLGYSVRQITFLGLPFYAYKEAGEVLYVRTPENFQIAGVGAGGVAGLEQELGQKLDVGIFPFWLYIWGWLAPLAVGLFGWFEWRNQRRRRELLGLL